MAPEEVKMRKLNDMATGAKSGTSDLLITTQATPSLSSLSGIGGVLSAT